MKVFVFASLVVSLLGSQNAFAWADRGHQIVGQIAEETMKPSTKDFVRGIMGVEPLAVSATFPDHVKDDPRFATSKEDEHNFSPFHYCQIPTGSTYDTKAQKDVKDCFGVIKGAIEILKSSSTKQVEKQIAIRYLVHVVGDIMNPYHVGNNFDQGGNMCKVKWSVGGKTSDTNIHAVWDDSLVDYLGQTYAKDLKTHKPAVYMSDYMVVIRNRFRNDLSQAGKDKYGRGELQTWLQESATLRESGVYPDDPNDMKSAPKGREHEARAYCQKDATKMPTINQAYADKWAPVVEKQIVIGGLRLASILDSIADGAGKSSATMSDSEQEAVLKLLQDHFKNH